MIENISTICSLHHTFISCLFLCSFHSHNILQHLTSKDVPPPTGLDPPTFRLWDLHAPITSLRQFLSIDKIQSMSSKHSKILARFSNYFMNCMKCFTTYSMESVKRDFQYSHVISNTKSFGTLQRETLKELMLCVLSFVLCVKL